ncbi:hypothetical protein GH714_032420 [Hevea brasiliensis]|uniref:Uncharacterized protein n=1 Tax=Hevea brasiliensis TaxID=3981 RepID=A0A6A6ND48_HEVBR|nr:hypothetical protein GH714_032420 [Hevea brasiliensis]
MKLGIRDWREESERAIEGICKGAREMKGKKLAFSAKSSLAIAVVELELAFSYFIGEPALPSRALYEMFSLSLWVHTSACSDTNKKIKLARSSNDSKLELFDSYLDSTLEDPGADCDSTDFSFEYLNMPLEELMSAEPHSMKMKKKLDIRENQCNEKATDLCDVGINMMTDDLNLAQDQATVRDLSESSYEQANTWSELNFQVTKLIEENLKQQVELARRNIQKKVVINRLRSQLEHLKSENKALQSSISRLKVGEKPNQLQMAKLKKCFQVSSFDKVDHDWNSSVVAFSAPANTVADTTPIFNIEAVKCLLDRLWELIYQVLVILFIAFDVLRSKGYQYVVNRPHTCVTISILDLFLYLETTFSNFNNHSIKAFSLCQTWKQLSEYIPLSWSSLELTVRS